VPRLAERQRDFAAALLDPKRPIPPGLTGPDGAPSPRRFAVYRNNVVAGLVDALRAAFPAVCRIVGAEFFRAMARAYVVHHPPGSPILLEYGAGFPEFVDGFEPAATLPYLGDVGRLERAWTEAYHAREALPLDPAAFAAVAPERRPGIRLVLHPSARLVRSRFPAITIWRMNVGDGVPAPVDFAAGGEDALIVRPLAEVEVRWLPEGGAEFVRALADGSSVLAAAEAATAADSRFDLAANLAGLIRSGALTGYVLAQDAESQASTR
jgi:hypothetical protein